VVIDADELIRSAEGTDDLGVGAGERYDPHAGTVATTRFAV
jgi:hypothetical protein